MRRNGIPVEEFTIGFGPTLFERKLKSGTWFRVKPILLGGYARPNKEGEEMLLNARPWVKFQVFIAGMLMNAIVSFIVLMILYYLLYFVGGKIPTLLLQYISWAPMILVPFLTSIALSFGIWLGTPFIIIYMLMQSASGFVDGMAGPIGIVNMGQQMVEASPTTMAIALNMFSFFAMINAAIAGMNILPIYPLDGGHIFEMLLKKISGRFHEPVIKYWRYLGIAIMLALVVFIFGNDIWNLVVGKQYF